MIGSEAFLWPALAPPAAVALKQTEKMRIHIARNNLSINLSLTVYPQLTDGKHSGIVLFPAINDLEIVFWLKSNLQMVIELT